MYVEGRGRGGGQGDRQVGGGGGGVSRRRSSFFERPERLMRTSGLRLQREGNSFSKGDNLIMLSRVRFGSLAAVIFPYRQLASDTADLASAHALYTFVAAEDYTTVRLISSGSETKRLITDPLLLFSLTGY